MALAGHRLRLSTFAGLVPLLMTAGCGPKASPEHSGVRAESVGRISGANSGDEDAIACNTSTFSPDGVCVAAYMRRREGTAATDTGTDDDEDHGSSDIVWSSGDPADPGSWTRHDANSTSGWRNVLSFSGRDTDETSWYADPAIVAIPQTAAIYPPRTLGVSGPVAPTPNRFAAHSNARGARGQGIGFVISSDGGKTFDAAPGVDASAGAPEGTRDRSWSAVDEETGAVWVFFTVQGPEVNGVKPPMAPFVRWLFSPQRPGDGTTMLPTPHPVPFPDGGGPGGHVSMAITHNVIPGAPPLHAPMRIPIINIAQTDHKLSPCSGTSSVTWQLSYTQYLGTFEHPGEWETNPDGTAAWHTSPIAVNHGYRHCAAPDDADDHYKINPVPKLVAAETPDGANFFVAVPWTENHVTNIRIFTAHWDQGTKKLSDWFPSTPSPTTTANQWRPTLALASSSDGTAKLVVQWMEAEIRDGTDPAPLTRPRAIVGAAPLAAINGTYAIYWGQPFDVNAAAPAGGGFRFQTTHGAVDYSSAAAIPAQPGGKFMSGGAIVTWSNQQVAGPFATLFARAFPN